MTIAGPKNSRNFAPANARKVVHFMVHCYSIAIGNTLEIKEIAEASRSALGSLKGHHSVALFSYPQNHALVGIAEKAGYGMNKLTSREPLTGTRPTIESDRTIATVPLS